ncbi:hypothetical protein ABW19_dt0208715 [Dactylella cylindrospora]|nr:hypothetical protein ABW19_dt0208715 [Dactylella cylindrospora]
MRSLVAVVLLAAAAVAQTLSKCAADNCLRAIRASAFPTRSGTADRSSYFLATVTPTTVTITETETVSTTTSTTLDVTLTVQTKNIEEPTFVKRQETIIPSKIPAYASACSGSVRYSSACSCIGVTASTITVLAPSTTITETTTVSFTDISTSVVAEVTATAFVMQLVDGLPGSYVKIGDESGFSVAKFTTSFEEAATFVIGPDGILRTTTGNIISYDGGFDASFIFFDASFGDSDPLQCGIDASNIISCTSGLYTEFGIYANSYSLDLGRTGVDWASYAGVGPVTIKAVPAASP